MEKVKMPHAGHDEHLCYLMNLVFDRESTGYMKLVRDANYICKQCVE